MLHTTADLDRTVRWVTRTMSRRREGADLELVVVGARLPRAVELPLAMLLATYPDARLLAPLARVGPAVCTNVGIAETSGEVVVLARTSANPPRDAFHGLTSALSDHDVAIAQPLVVDRPGAGGQRRRGVRAGTHPPRAVPGRLPGGRRAGPQLARGPRAAVPGGGGAGLGAGAAARPGRLGRRRAARGRARHPDGRLRRRDDRGRAQVAARPQGRAAAPPRHRLRRRPRPAGALAGVPGRVRGGVGPRRASRSSAAGGRTAPYLPAPTTTRSTSPP